MKEALERLCSINDARIDCTDSIPYGLRYSIVDNRGRVIYVNSYDSGKIHVDGRGFETEFIARLGQWARETSSTEKQPHFQRTWTVPREQLARCSEILIALGGAQEHAHRWASRGWVATYYPETGRLLVQGKNIGAVATELTTLIS